MSGKEKRLPNPPGGNYWWNRLSSGPMQQDVFFTADFDNNGTEKVIHKGRSISQTKYYDDYQWFQIYESRTDFDNGNISVKSPDFHDDFYGLYSGGNLYDLLPLGSHVVQFWTQEHDSITYCISLQKHELLYTLQIYAVQNGEAGLVRKSLLIDEAQIRQLSELLQHELPGLRGFGEVSLKKMRLFYEAWQSVFENSSNRQLPTDDLNKHKKIENEMPEQWQKALPDADDMKKLLDSTDNEPENNAEELPE